MKKIFFLFISILLYSTNMWSQDYTQVYLIGEATPFGWNNEKAVAMTLESSDEESVIFSWTGLLKAKDFKFINKLQTWQPSFNSSISDEIIELNKTHNLVYNESGNDHKFMLSEEGFYTIKIDLKKLTMVVTKAESNLPEELWIIGSAIPGTKIKLSNAYTFGSFLYLGELISGDFKITTTETINENTQYIVPLEEDMDITGQTTFQLTNDASIPGWNVMIADPVYKIKFDLLSKLSNAEVFKSRENLYMVGGATEIGWNANHAIPFVKDELNPDIFIFRGELKVRPHFEESNLFKILGQLDWGPYSLHPFNPNESILDSHYLQISTGDNKWAIQEHYQGNYVIRVNTLFETIEAEFTGDSSIDQNFDYVDYFQLKNINGSIIISMKNDDQANSVQLVDMNGKSIRYASNTEQEFVFENIPSGIYILKVDCKKRNLIQRVIVK